MAPRPATPAQELAKLRPVVFHAAAYGSWPSIAELGLQTAASLAAESGSVMDSIRPGPVDITLPTGANGAAYGISGRRCGARSRTTWAGWRWRTGWSS